MDGVDRMRVELLRAFWPQYDPLIRTMTADGIAVASQLALVSTLVGVETGSIGSPWASFTSFAPSALSGSSGCETSEKRARGARLGGAMPPPENVPYPVIFGPSFPRRS